MSREALSFYRLFINLVACFFHVRPFHDIISLELALILIQYRISRMHLGNMIEAFFDLLKPTTK